MFQILYALNLARFLPFKNEIGNVNYHGKHFNNEMISFRETIRIERRGNDSTETGQ